MTEVTPLDLLSSARALKHRVFLARRDSERRTEAARLRSDPVFRAQYTAAENGLDVPPLQHHPGPWAIAMVRNEADVIETAVRHLVRQGVDNLLIVDNLSEDDTPQVLARLANEFPQLHVGTDNEPAYYQSAKMTRLADLVSAAGARWIIPFDADELWFAPHGRLVDALAASGTPVRRAHLYNLFPTLDGKQWRLDTARHFDDKVAFRPWEGAVVAMGNHEVSRPGSRDVDGLRILHMPWRSFEQFARKTRIGAAAVAKADLDDGEAYHWRWLGSASEDDLRRVWRRLLAGEAVASAAWYPRGTLRPIEGVPPLSWADVQRLLQAGSPGDDAPTR
ncbi:glycosyltransferase family 2 protein [Micrococcus sp. HOU01]|uniref:glycosyltransferase family 2 protein n=1 Tax=Micrococcus sp. HOU01 TaxID=3101753 RepID=UPI002D785933|nr:glycosyltransferase family 2 protein [Micrococcus sp. HOU1]WRQ43307.1 glycosyltransferase family 2 protein [Micrococcus sp. HOU1]